MNGIKKECYRLVQQVVLKQRPYCEYPGCNAKATAGHHIFKRDRMGTAFDPESIMSLCHRHHVEIHNSAEKEAIERAWLKDRYEEKEKLSRMIVRFRKADFERIKAALRRLLD
jgi:hypothetical protein